MTFVELDQAKATLVNTIDISEIGLTAPDYRQKIVDVARGTGGTLQSQFADLDKKWATAQQGAS